MSSFNKVILMGNFTRDPELRQTQSGTSVCRFSIAVNRSYNSQDGSTRDETCFVEVDSFGRTAENIAKFFSKGRPILIEGRLRQDSWELEAVLFVFFIIERFEFVGSRDQQGGGYGGGGYDGGDYSSSSPAPRQPRRQPQQRSEDLEDDDVPF